METFISNNLRRKKDAKRICQGTIFSRYLFYCDLTGVKPLSTMQFYKELESRGFKRKEIYFYNAELKDRPCKY